ncbi:MAG: PAS domain S-box protein [Deltaproteobacteria bacterium]|nr:PAS domain S-box protein [Deltaproteobacteria bacterium]
MRRPLYALIIEDSENDALLMLLQLKKGGYEPEYERVETAEAMRKALHEKAWDVILCDYQLPQFNGPSAMALLKETGLDIPLIIVSGKIGEETAADCMRCGAADCIMKGNLARLVPAIERELLEAAGRREKKKGEEALRKSEEKYRILMDGASDAIILADAEGNFLETNQRAEKLLGYSKAELLGMNVQSIHPQEQLEAVLSTYKEIREKGLSTLNDAIVLRKDGKTVPVDITGSAIEVAGGTIYQGIFRDITERKRVEQARALGNRILNVLNRPSESDKFMRDVLVLIKENLGIDAVAVRLKEGDDFPYYDAVGLAPHFMEADQYLCARDGAGDIIRDAGGNPVLECMCGDVLSGRTDPSLPFFTEGGSFWTNNTSGLPASVKEADRQARMLRFCHGEGCKSAALIPLKAGDSVIGLLQLNGQRKGRFTKEAMRFLERIGNSIGSAVKRRWMETDLRLAEEKYRSIFESSQEGIYRSTPEGRFIMANRAMARIFGYDSPEELIAGITDIAGQIYADPAERTAIMEVIREQGFVRNHETRFRKKDGRAFWVSMTMQAICDDQGRVVYYDGITEDIDERKQSADRVERALTATVHAIAAVVETKDPYTAGHQRRTTDLARSIAAEMGLPAEELDFIRMAAVIHDIGKIAVPAEILSKPTKLTDIEFDLIKIHSQAGYDILKDIDFPWPVAEVILQHHERINGSGYPRGLKGDAILPEARILSVADVVEAISSHRPYRAALGIDPALEEITKNRAILYDPDAVDACLRLFHDKGYQLVH